MTVSQWRLSVCRTEVADHEAKFGVQLTTAGMMELAAKVSSALTILQQSFVHATTTTSASTGADKLVIRTTTTKSKSQSVVCIQQSAVPGECELNYFGKVSF